MPFLRSFFAQSAKNDLRNPLIDCSTLESANYEGILQSPKFAKANFGFFGMT